MYVPGFKILSMLLGSEPVLEPPAQFYQRMLSMESEDMLELAGNFVEERSLEEFYEEVFLPALIMSEKDRHSGALSAERQRFIFQSSLDLVEELERQEETSRTESSTAVAAGPDIPVVLGIAARDDADEIVAQMVCHLLRRRGISAAVGAREARPREIADAVHQKKMKAVFISALPPSAVVGARQMWRRLSAECPDVPILVGVWRHDTALDDLGHRLRVTQADQVVTTLEAALTHVENILRSGNSGAAQPRNAPAQNSAPLAVGS
jgi:hypothetical protein